MSTMPAPPADPPFDADRTTSARSPDGHLAPLRKITVAFGPHGEPTLRWAAGLARLAGAPLEIFNVLQPTYAEVSTRWFDELVTGREQQLARVTAELGDLDVSVVVRDGVDPLRDFADFLHESPGSLGVVGAHHAHRLARLWFGGSGHWLLHHSDEPIAIVHPDNEPPTSGVVVVAVDASVSEGATLEWAEQFTRAIGGSVHAVYSGDGDRGVDEDRVRRVVDQIVSVPVELHELAGRPTEALIEHARRERAVAIVTGTGRHGGFEGMAFGWRPGAGQLVAHATTPLIVVPS